MFLLHGALIGACGLLAAASAIAAVTRDDAEIQRWIAHHAQRAHSSEAAQVRHRVIGDLNGDGRADAAVLYTLKPRAGRRGESRYLAVFKRHAREGLRYHAHTLVMGPGAGEANRVTILNRTVVVETLTFGPTDAACCPTRTATRRYRMGPRGLTLAAAEGLAQRNLVS